MSAFESKIIAVHALFSSRINFRTSSVNYVEKMQEDNVVLIIDGVELKLDEPYGYVDLEDLGFDAELLEEYGIYQ